MKCSFAPSAITLFICVNLSVIADSANSESVKIRLVFIICLSILTVHVHGDNLICHQMACFVPGYATQVRNWSRTSHLTYHILNLSRELL